MKFVRKALTSALAVLMAVSMLMMSACSTPAVAMTIDGKEYTTGEYIANLYNNFYNIYYSGGLYQYAQYGMDPWEQTMDYGEGDETITMTLADYLVQITKDEMARQKAVENMMAEYGVAADEELMAEFETNFETYKESDMLVYGFNKEHYKNMYIAANINERSLFYGLYDEGGKKAVTADEIRAFFDKSYVAYKAITVSLMDEEGNEMSDADKQAAKDNLNNYLELYKASGDFDAVIAQYDADTAEQEAAEDPENPLSDETEETAEDTTDETADTATTDEDPGTGPDEEEADEADADADAADADAQEQAEDTTDAAQEDVTTLTAEEEDDNLQLVNSVSGDEAIVEAVLEVKENEAKIVEYTTESGTVTAALVLRLNVEQAGGEGYYEEQHESCIYGMKFEEFDKEVKAAADALTVTYNDAAINACDPKSFTESN